MEQEASTMCPSARCQAGSVLLGIVQKEGHVSFLGKEKLIVDEQFVQIAKSGRPPEKRFRFANNCLKSGCKQWTGSRCSVIDTVFKFVPMRSEFSELPNCSIREQCRWYKQSGSRACAVCPEVITDLI
jgi:hypothetical protein